MSGTLADPVRGTGSSSAREPEPKAEPGGAEGDLLYRELAPPSDLAAIIDRVWYMRGTGAARPERVLPDGRIEIIFNLAERFRHRGADGRSELQPGALVVGPTTRHMLIEPTGRVELIGIRVKPAGALALLGAPIAELTDRTEDLCAVESRLGPDLLDRLADSAGSEASWRILVAALRAARGDRQPDPAVRAACRIIHATGGRARVGDLAARVGSSPRTLERRFGSEVGFGPKLLCRLARFHRTLRMAEVVGPGGLLRAALDSGYFDQPHLLRDFREFAGVTPSVFFGHEENRMSAAFTGREGDI